MKPYFQDEYVTLFHGDCLEVSEWLDADVLITDPPYGMAYKSGMDRTGMRTFHDAIHGDESSKARDDMLSMWSSDKAAIVFGTWRISMPSDVKQVVIWDKSPCGFMGDLSIPFGPTHEEIYIMGKHGWNGKREPSVINHQMLMSADKNRPNHPTPKPIGLMESLINKTTGIIADPFAGSGSTLVAARNLGRKSVGVEIDEKYCEIIAQRLSQQSFIFEDA